jgi:Do/DeqQ family serine protease
MNLPGKLKGIILIIGLAAIFMLMGLVIGSNLGSDKLVAQEKSQPVATKAAISLINGHSPFVAVAEKVKPAVVNISAKSMVENRYHNMFNFDDDIWRRFFGAPPDSKMPPQMRRSESLGSGFFISNDGYILTNNHVVKAADDILVKLSDTKEYKAKVIGADSETDIALLKIDADETMPYLELGDSDSILVGDWAIAVGNPFPQLGLDRTVTVGVVSALGRTGLVFGPENPVYQNYIQTDASINPGNSGGPLVNIDGNVIGINSAIVSPSGGNIGIGFAVPINLAKKVSEQLKKSGSISRGWLGMLPKDIDNNMAEALGLPSAEGVLVESVEPNSPAESGGLKTGDIILEFNGDKVTNAQQFRFLVADAGPGAGVTLKILRDGSNRTLSLNLGDRSQFLAQASSEKQEQADTKWLGLSVSTFTREMADSKGVDYQPGVIITDIEPNSQADDGGLFAGDIILEINRQPMKTKSDFLDMAGKLAARQKSILFLIRREKTTMFKAIKP